MGVHGGVHPLAPLPTPAVSNKSSAVRGGDVSIGSSGGNPDVWYLEGVTPTAEVLAVVSEEEAIAT